MLKKLLLLIVLACMFYTTKAQSKVKEIRFDPLYTRSGKASQFIEKYEVIPLETNKASYFGEINQFHATKHYYIIGDFETDAILIFNKDGRFKAKIDVSSLKIDDRVKIPGPFLDRFHVLTDKDIIILKSGLNPKSLYFFDCNGILLKSENVSFKFKDYSFLNKTTYFRPELPIFYTVQGQTKISDTTLLIPWYLRMINVAKDTLNLFPINYSETITENQHPGKFENFNQINDSTVIFKQFFNYNFYELGNSGITEHYKFIFPYKYSLYTTRFEWGSGFPKDVYLGAKDIYKVRKNIFYISLLSIGSASMYKPNLLYNDVTGNFVSLNQVIGDEVTYNLNTFYSRILGVDEDYFVSSMPSLTFYPQIKRIIEAKKDLPAILTNYYQSSSIKSNPVIIRYIPKSTF